jgi:serine protease
LLNIRLTVFLAFLSVVNVLSAQTNYVQNELIVKLKPNTSISEISKSTQRSIGIIEMISIFQNTDPRGIRDTEEADFKVFHSIFLNGEVSVLKAASVLFKTGLFEYVEPRYIGELAYTSNDPGLSTQYALQLIQAQDAWDLNKGSSTVLIGVVDAGIDTGHVDLKGKYFENTSDPINGVDDDNDGFIDNYWGWDFKSKTGNVQFSGGVDHGVQMSGVIAPNTDNGIGIAGVGFNCKMLGIKVTNGSAVVYGYEGIKYAADKGCKIINCSWNIKAYSRFGEEMVDYATIKGALVVAATGNQGKEDNNYPAQYKNVLAVTNTDLNDNRVSNSNIGYYADISSPGLNVVSTTPINGYKRNSGTSYSSALVSGAAALLASYAPSLSSQELKYRLKAGSESLYRNGKNSFYKNKLGVGRLNIYKAMAFTNAWLELDSIAFSDIEGGAIEQADTVEVSAWIANYLNNENGVRVTLRDLSNYATVLDSFWVIPFMAKDQKENNALNPFRIRLDSSIPQNEELEFEIEIISQNDTNTFGFSIPVNPTSRDITINKLHMTIGSRGTFGYYEYPEKKGIGVTYNGGSQLLYEGGLIIGQGVDGNSKVVDRIRGVRDVEQTDFRTTSGLQEITPPTSDLGFYSQFDDQNSKSPINITVDQSTRAWKKTSHDSYVIIDYVIKSKSNQKLENIYVGLFADWDLDDSEKNRAKYDGQRHIAYTYSETANVSVAGIQLLSEYDDWRCYSIDHIIGGEGGVDLTDNDVFSKEEKFKALSNFRENAGENGEGGDVLQLLSTGPHTIEIGDSLKVSFAIHAADNLTQLLENADSAFYQENGALPMSVVEISNQEITLFPNPSSGKVTIKSKEEINANSIQLFNSIGDEVPFEYSLNKMNVILELKEPQTGFYFIKTSQKTSKWSVIR